MLTNFKNWVKQNKIATLIIVVLAVIVIFKGQYRYFPFINNMMYGTKDYGGGKGEMGYPIGGIDASYPQDLQVSNYPYSQATPTLNVIDRKIITEASLSLQVKSVSDTIKNVKSKITALGGYIVNSYVNRPEFGESGNISARVPSDKMEEFLTFIRSNAVKVVDENINGSDITDQFVDLETRLIQLTEQKARLEAILKAAVTVEDIMSVQPYITQVQYEIDSVKGQTKYIDGASKSSLITMYLSTDELSLPYTPEQSWRPQVVFKNAMRSLLTHTQRAGTALIWLGVYSIVIAPVLAIVLIIYLLKKRKHQS